MTLIKSISGIRGTIGGVQGEGLTPPDIVKFTSAFAYTIKKGTGKKRPLIVTGRDARISGAMVLSLVNNSLSAMGCDIITLGIASTPTVELAVQGEGADGGIIVTASHNPAEWNALKLLGSNGEFISAEEGEEVVALADGGNYLYSGVYDIGDIKKRDDYNRIHIDLIAQLPLVNIKAIQSAGFTVALDCINSAGALILPDLLKRLGVERVVGVNMEADGRFSHNPEPVPVNLGEIANLVKESGTDVGFVVDPDVDRLAIVSEDGSFFNEEYTLVACADYVLSHTPGNTVSNMSSSRALRDITRIYGGEWFSSAVGEVNVVREMKRRNAVIGGEGNGGIIYPPLHYGRDALLGIALFLSNLALSGKSCSELRRGYPEYVISKKRVDLKHPDDAIVALEEVERVFEKQITDRRDGIMIENKEGWVQVRKSNTESIIRIYSEASDAEKAEKLASDILKIVKKEK
ncbi:MAG: phosphoglucosamine mutase [Bacteroidales bacterium]|nr:phosphoglucosamine mutase [Bacteroidales bacterium]